MIRRRERQVAAQEYAISASRPASPFSPNSMQPLPGSWPWRSSAASSAIPASPQPAFAPARKTLGVTALRALAGCNVGQRALLHVKGPGIVAVPRRPLRRAGIRVLCAVGIFLDFRFYLWFTVFYTFEK